MNLRGYRSFSTELLKIATEIQDPDVRALVADRKGEEYLVGGRLPADEEMEQGVIPKEGSIRSVQYGAMMGGGWRGKKQMEQNAYEKGRDATMATARGAMTGVGIGALGHGLLGKAKEHKFEASAGAIRGAAAIGGGLALANHVYSRHKAKERGIQPAAMAKVANLISQTFSPARELHAGQQTAHFENKVHMPKPKAAPGLMGKDGRI